jgi:hypothetical protein
VVKLARATGGSTTHNTAEMRRMETGKQRTNMGATNAGKGEEGLAPVIVPVEELEPAIVPAEGLEPATGQAEVQELPIGLPEALEPATDQAEVQELGIGLVEERELVIVPAVEELELVRVAVAQKTRLGTAAHLRDLVRHLAAEVDLVVAAAETTRERAATEAATAWVAEE